jgi:hypothetical protein
MEDLTMVWLVVAMTEAVVVVIMVMVVDKMKEIKVEEVMMEAVVVIVVVGEIKDPLAIVVAAAVID